MISAGIDVGGKNVHIAIIKNGNIIVKVEAPTGIHKAKITEALYEDLLEKAGINRNDINRVIATGSFGKIITFADGYVPDIAADAYCVNTIIPTARTIIDIGAEEGRAIRINSEGVILDFATNEKCAAGTGTFVDAMARALEITTLEMARISRDSARDIPMNAQCAVFGESEVVSLIHQQVSKPDIARAIHNAIAGRIGSIARIIGLEKDVVMVGGVANNAGIIDSLEREIGMEIIVPDDPGFTGSVGAAFIAASGSTNMEPKT